MHTFLKMSCFQLVPQRERVDEVGCRFFFGGLICTFVIDILDVPSGCNQIGNGCTTRTCIPPATCLLDRDVVKP